MLLEPEYRVKSLPFGFSCEVPADMPVVGLALSGGGARGISQIGVLKAFEEAEFPIDIIVGTSIGSIVGGLYSAGYTPQMLDTIAVSTDWNDLLTIDTKDDRNELFIDQKITEERAVFSIRLKGLEPILPTSINDGQKLLNYLNLLTFQAPLQVNNNFDELEKKFRAVCTDLEKGVPYVWRSGSLSRAMRASSSVSFFLSPVKIDSLILVDGGLVANTPAAVTRNEGADYVIAINTTSPLNSKNELDLPWMYADQVLSIPMKLVNQRQLEFADFIIEPNINEYSAADFSNIRDLIDKGYYEAKLYTGSITAQIDSIYRANLEKDAFYIHNIMPADSSSLASSYINRYAERDSVSSAEILYDLYQLKREENYKRVFAELVKTAEGTNVRFNGEKLPVIKKVRCEGITLLDSANVERMCSLLEGSSLYCPNVVAAIKSLLIDYNKEGYSLAELTTKHFNEADGTLSLEFDEGIISEIRIEGNRKTNSAVILREMPISQGDVFRSSKIQQGLMNLRGTGLFDAVDITVEKTNNKSVVIIKVEEKISNVLRLGFRVINENTPRVSIDIRDENIFGSATELGALFFLSPRHNRAAFEHKANRIFDTYITYNINAFYEIRDRYNYVNEQTQSDRSFSRKREGSYRERLYGLSLSAGSQTGRFGNLILQARYEVNKLRNLEFTPVGEYDINIFTLRWSSMLDTRDQYPYSREGIYFNGYYETAQKILNGEVSYSKLYGDYRGFFSINDENTFQTRVTVGIADKTLPLTKQFALGGQYSFFGMREDEFRGRQVFRTSLEYRLLLPFTLFFDTYFKFRYDIGSMWTETEQIRIKDLRHGIGATLSFDTPLGPADFAIGRSFLFSKDLPDNPIKVGPLFFYFSIGYQYQW